jgi:YVTN family beta-propeller protein
MKSECCVLLVAMLAAAPSALGGSGGYRMVGKFVVPAKPGDLAWDNITVDSENKLLYVAHGDKVDVINAATGILVGEVSDTPDVHDVVVVPALGKGFTTNGRSDRVTVFDMKTFAHKADIKVGHKPDAVAYDPDTRLVYVTNTGSNDIQAIDPKTEQVVATSPLGDATENIVFDDKSIIWAILEDTHTLVALNAKTLRVNRQIPLLGCTAPSGMAIDRPQRRLFIGCRSRVLVIVDADKGSIIARFPIGEHIDTTIFDPETQLIFTSTGDGNITIVHQDSPDKYTLVQTVKTMRGAKTMALDPQTKKLFLPTVEDVPLPYSGAPDPADAPYTPGRFVIVIVDTSAQTPPLKLVHRIPVPNVTEFDHLGVDTAHSRLFSCAEAEGKIEVFDLLSNKLIHELRGLLKPHSLFYRGDLDRLYVVDGNDYDGAVRIYDGKDYRLIKNVALYPGADWSTNDHDAATTYLYVTASGDVLKHTYSRVSVVDTDKGEKIADITVQGSTIGGIAADAARSRLYLGNKNEKNEIDVIDLNTKKVIAAWPLTIGKKPGPVFLDAITHRLYVGCRSGDLVIFDTTNGRELAALASNTGADDIIYDRRSRRLYVSGYGKENGGRGTIDVYEQAKPDEYKWLGRVTTALKARNGTLFQDLNKYFVEKPSSGQANAELLIYDVQ